MTTLEKVLWTARLPDGEGFAVARIREACYLDTLILSTDGAERERCIRSAAKFLKNVDKDAKKCWNPIYIRDAKRSK